MHKNDSFMTCTTSIQFFANLSKIIYFSNNVFVEFESEFFRNKEVYLSYFLEHYIEKTVDNIRHNGSMNSLKSNMDKAAYESNVERFFALPFERSVLNCHANEIFGRKQLLMN